jgi:putative hemolysin
VQEFTKGRYRVRLAKDGDDLIAAQRLRFRAFRNGTTGREGRDADAFDARCRHVLVQSDTGDLLATCRLYVAAQSEALSTAYSAQFYDLDGLSALRGPYLEVGRFCLDAPADQGSDALRLVWAALTRIVEAEGISVLFGCSSFPGNDPAQHADALALLAARHLGPDRLRPVARKGETVRLQPADHDPKAAAVQMPPLLRTYLMMGGWVGGDAVIDRDLGTLHVFTAVEVAAIPPVRARLLRADAA